MVASTPPPAPAALVLAAPAEREVSFGRIAGRVPPGRWVVVVRIRTRTLAVRRVAGGSFDFYVSLPRRDATIRVTAYAAHRRARTALVRRHVFGLPRSARLAGRRRHSTAASPAPSGRWSARFRGRAGSTSRISSAAAGRPGTRRAVPRRLDPEGGDRGRGPPGARREARGPARTSTRSCSGC